jgi:sortase A
MALYKYVKSYPQKPVSKPVIFSFGLIMVGLCMLLWTVWPIMSFSLITKGWFNNTISPLPDNFNVVSPISVLAAETTTNNENINYNNPNAWYPDKPQKIILTPISEYTLTIPKLNIIDAKVVIAGDELDKSLIHYGGTGLPGEFGNTVIFGHSTLPQLFDQHNYKTIFALVPTLKPKSDTYPGDEIYLNYDGMTYKYVIYDMVVTKPTDLSGLEQRYDASYLTLITCVPPGTYWERLNVKAKLAPLK